jgi:outer membrane receptor protein involved in Fe transport
VKTDLLGKRLFFTATSFNLVFDNIVQQGTDPLTNTTIFYLSGSTKSKGAELGLGGRLWGALTLRIALSRVDAVLGGNLGANAVLNGLAPRSVAVWNHGTVLKYDFKQDALQGAFVGTNVIAQSNIRSSDSTAGGRHRVRVPGWARFDFNAGYKWMSNGRRWTHQVSAALKHTFDIEYAYGTGPSQGNSQQVILRYSVLFK